MMSISDKSLGVSLVSHSQGPGSWVAKSGRFILKMHPFLCKLFEIITKIFGCEDEGTKTGYLAQLKQNCWYPAKNKSSNNTSDSFLKSTSVPIATAYLNNISSNFLNAWYKTNVRYYNNNYRNTKI